MFNYTLIMDNGTNNGANEMKTFTAHNASMNTTIDTDDMAEAMAHVGAHVHVTRENGFTAYPMDLQNGTCGVNRVTLWASLTGRTVRRDVTRGTPKGTVAGWIRRNK